MNDKIILDYQTLLSYIQGLYDNDEKLDDSDYRDIVNFILNKGNVEDVTRDLIQIRRGLKEFLPQLANGEMGYCTDTNELFIGNNNNNELIGSGGIDGIADAKDYGVIGDGVTDVTEALQTAINENQSIYLDNGQYLITKTIYMKHNQTLFVPNGAKLIGNFNGDMLLNDGVIYVNNDGEDYEELPAHTNELLLGNNTITYSTNPNLNIGDVICIYDSLDGSFNSARVYYRKGEFLKVDKIDGNTVTFVGAFKDSYIVSSTTKTYKMNMGTFKITGSLEIVSNNARACIILNRVKDFNLSNLTTNCDLGYSSVELNQCYNGVFSGVVNQNGTNGGYGLIVVNTQSVIFNGTFSGTRHGVSNGSGDGVGAVPCRELQYAGVFNNAEVGSGTNAFDCHGNTDGVSANGIFNGGINIGGSNHSFRGLINVGSGGVCVYFNELLNYNHSFRDMVMRTSGSVGSSYGVVSLGYTNNADVPECSGGTIDLSNVKIHAPNCERGIIITNRNVTDNVPINVNCSNLYMKLSNDAQYSIRVFALSTANKINRVIMTNSDYDASKTNLTNVIDFIGQTLKGSTIKNTATNTNFIEIPVTFNQLTYVPDVSVTMLSSNLIGGKLINYVVGGVTTNSFKIYAYTIDGTNFTSVASLTFNYKIN